MIFVAIGLLLNNISTLEKRKYPLHWYPDFNSYSTVSLESIVALFVTRAESKPSPQLKANTQANHTDSGESHVSVDISYQCYDSHDMLEDAKKIVGEQDEETSELIIARDYAVHTIG